MNSEELEREFAPRGVLRGGILLFTPADALSLVQKARSARVPILGIDGFYLGPASTQPDLAHGIDLSGASCRTNPWAEAVAFLEEREESALHFEVILGGMQASG